MICGSKQAGDLTALAADATYASLFGLLLAGAPIKLSVVAGPGGEAALTPLVYDEAGLLLTRGAPVIVPARSAPRTVVDLELPAAPGLAAAGDLWLAVHTSASILLAIGHPGTGVIAQAGPAPGILNISPAASASASYGEGTYEAATYGFPASGITEGELQAFMLLDATAPLVADDLTLATQGSISAQRALSTAVEPQSLQVAACGWHGQGYDPPRGMLAIVAADGPLADLVGERLRVSARFSDRSVVVKCHADDSVYDRPIAEDLSLTRRAFMLLAPAATEELAVEVEVMI